MSHVTGDTGGSSNEGSSAGDDLYRAAAVRHTAIAWWQTATAALVVGFVALLCAVASHHWTPPLIIVTIASIVLTATFGVGGLARWNEAAYAEDWTGGALGQGWLLAITIGMIALVMAALFAI